jgi:hypothetical protein
MRKHFEVGGASDCIGDALARVVEADDGVDVIGGPEVLARLAD